MTKAANRNTGDMPYLYPGIFGSKINDWGLREAVEMFDTNTRGHPDSVKVNHKKFMQGNMIEFSGQTSDVRRLKQFKIYLDELDRRRGTNWTKIYPQMFDIVKDL